MRGDNAGAEQIRHQLKYEAWIRKRGVGSRNRTGDSVESYVTYLRKVSRELRMEIGPKTVCSHADAETIANRLVKERRVNERTAANCRTALKHYADMVEAEKLV